MIVGMSQVNQPDFSWKMEDALRLTAIAEVTEHELTVDDYFFKLVDCRTSINQTKKWLRMFEDMSATVFVVSLADYNAVLPDDPTRTLLHEALDLFESLCNHHVFRDKSAVVFFTNQDIFLEKLRHCDLVHYFPTYSPKVPPVDYLKNLFKTKGDHTERSLIFRVLSSNDDMVSIAWQLFSDLHQIALDDAVRAVDGPASRLFC